MMCSGPFDSAQGHSNWQTRTERRRSSEGPCPTSPAGTHPRRVAPLVRHAVPGQCAAPTEGSETQLPVAQAIVAQASLVLSADLARTRRTQEVQPRRNKRGKQVA